MIAQSGLIPVPITAYSTVNACGIGNETLYTHLLEGRTALKEPKLLSVEFDAYTGEVPSQSLPKLSDELSSYSTRNAQIALAALNHPADRLRNTIERAIERYGPHRIAVVLGTSTSGIYETENAYIHTKSSGQLPEKYHFAHQHVWAATARFLHSELNLSGPCYAISTACSSSNKSIAAAQRLIASGVCDAVLAGGVDSLCRMTLEGFHSLDLVSTQPCTPLDENRDGISLGEGAGLIFLERPHFSNKDCPKLIGAGESSDAHHMTAPHPQGEGAVLAMQKSLMQASLKPQQINYLNLHATGTPKNDASEMIAVDRVFKGEVVCSGTKGLTGHALGAAGGVESVITLLSIERGFRPGSCGLNTLDPNFNARVLRESEPGVQIDYSMCNNYGFGGNNASLIFGRADD